MNIQNIKELETVEGWVEFVAIIQECKEIKGRVKSNLSKSPGEAYNVQKLSVSDITGQIGIWAIINQTFQFLPGQQVKVNGMVKEYQGKRYLDFCRMTLMQEVQSTPQNSPQMPQNPPQGTNAYQDAQQAINQPKDDYQVIRSYAVNAAILLASRDKILMTEIYNKSDEIINYIIHKRHPHEVAGVGSNPTNKPIEDENWPE
jgi:hypothetical protein